MQSCAFLALSTPSFIALSWLGQEVSRSIVPTQAERFQTCSGEEGGQGKRDFFFNVYHFLSLFFFFFSCFLTASFVWAVSGLAASCGIFLGAALALWLCHVGSRAHRLSSCSTRAQFLGGMWDLSYPTRDRSRVPCSARWICKHGDQRSPRFQSPD